MNQNFTTYDYLSKTVKQKEQTMVMDTYSAFGWEYADTTPNSAAGTCTVTFKRDRKIRHKAELNRLQRKAEGLKESLERLEAKKTGGAKMFAYPFGCFATLVFGAGMCLTMVWGEGGIPLMASGIAVGVAGIALCGLNYLFYKRIVKKSTEKVVPQIEETEEKLAIVCEQAHGLLTDAII